MAEIVPLFLAATSLDLADAVWGVSRGTAASAKEASTSIERHQAIITYFLCKIWRRDTFSRLNGSVKFRCQNLLRLVYNLCAKMSRYQKIKANKILSNVLNLIHRKKTRQISTLCSGLLLVSNAWSFFLIGLMFTSSVTAMLTDFLLIKSHVPLNFKAVSLV